MASKIHVDTGGGPVERNIIGGTNNTINNYESFPEHKQNLVEAAADIQALLEQLEKSYPTNTTTSKMALATQAMQHIDGDPNLTAKILSALRTGSVKALEQLLSHPAASFVIGALEDWQNNKNEGS